MEQLPPEIAELICDDLEQADIPNVRLVSRFWNNVASPCLLHKPKLVFKQDSFNRLLDISKHPFFSKLVTGLIYEPNTLRHKGRKEWESFLSIPRFIDECPMPPLPDATDRDRRVYRRDLVRLRKQRVEYTEEQLDKAWKMFERYYEEQEHLRLSYGMAGLTEALRNFPNLRKVSMNHGWGLWCGDGYTTDDKKNPYAQALTNTGADDWHAEPSGVPQMRALVRAVHQAGISLHSLRIGQVSWQLLLSAEEFLLKMKEVLAPLKRLELRFGMGYSEDGEEIGIEIPDCRDYIDENDTLYDLISAATDVENLCIAFDWSDPYCPANLEKHIPFNQMAIP